jgi:hypothetical protein
VEWPCFDSVDGGAGILKTLLALTTIVILAGCSTQSDSIPYSLTISETGLGAIHPDTQFDQIEGKLSGFNIDKLSQVSAQQSELIIQLKRGKQVFAQIIFDTSGKKISQIVILSPQIKNIHNQGIGEELTPQNLLCDKTNCRYSDEPSVSYRLGDDNRTIREITFSRL